MGIIKKGQSSPPPKKSAPVLETKTETPTHSEQPSSGSILRQQNYRKGRPITITVSQEGIDAVRQEVEDKASKAAPPSSSIDVSTLEKSTLPEPDLSPAQKTAAQMEAFESDLAQKRASVELEIESHRKQLFANIEEEKNVVLDDAYKNGFEEGKKEGLAHYNEKSQELLDTINAVMTEKNAVLKATRREVLRLSVRIAEQILKSEISLNQAVCTNIVAEALSRVTDKDNVIIRVNKADADYVKNNQDRFNAILGQADTVKIMDDPRVEQGGCIIETNLGYVDSTISTKLDNIQHALLDAFEESDTDPDYAA